MPALLTRFRINLTPSLRGWFVLLAAFVGVSAGYCLSTAFARGTTADRIAERWQKLALDLEEVAVQYDLLGLATDAARIRAELGQGLALTAEELPERAIPELPGSSPEAVGIAWERERRLRTLYSDAIYKDARAMLIAGRTAEAKAVLRHALAVNSDARGARETLGYVRKGDTWKTPFQLKKEDAGEVWDDRFGWVRKDYLPRYEAGERNFRRRWITADEEAAIRKNFEYAWEVETDHFLVKTNVSLETAASLARRLETFHDYFHRQFGRLFNSREAAREYLKAPSRRRRTKHEVHYYASQAEYIQRLSPKQQGVGITRGIYLPKDRVSYFYHDPQDDTPLDTLYHEVTHQMLFEADPKFRAIGTRGGYWAIEGLACYFESFVEPELAAATGRPVVGDVNHVRIEWARQRVLEEGFYIPLGKFDPLGKTLFQNPSSVDQLGRRYSQSTGLTHFFLHYDDGRYRDQFLDYVARLYATSTGSRRSLEAALGVPYALLDQQYRDHLTLIEQNAAGRPTAQLPTQPNE